MVIYLRIHACYIFHHNTPWLARPDVFIWWEMILRSTGLPFPHVSGWRCALLREMSQTDESRSRDFFCTPETRPTLCSTRRADISAGERPWAQCAPWNIARRSSCCCCWPREGPRRPSGTALRFQEQGLQATTEMKYNYMYRRLQHYRNFSTQKVYLWFLWFSQLADIISTDSMSRIGSVAETWCVSCEVPTGCLNI
jgi:hypothetical protein